jgi:hypothetical protein
VDVKEQKDGVLVYPNPVENGQLSVQSIEQGLLFLYDLSGREIAQFNIQKGKNRLGLSIPTGMYFVVMECNSVFYKKTVVFR